MSSSVMPAPTVTWAPIVGRHIHRWPPNMAVCPRCGKVHSTEPASERLFTESTVLAASCHRAGMDNSTNTMGHIDVLLDHGPCWTNRRRSLSNLSETATGPRTRPDSRWSCIASRHSRSVDEEVRHARRPCMRYHGIYRAPRDGAASAHGYAGYRPGPRTSRDSRTCIAHQHSVPPARDPTSGVRCRRRCQRGVRC